MKCVPALRDLLSTILSSVQLFLRESVLAMFFCVCIYIYISMAHYWDIRTTRDKSGRRIERSTSAVGLPETASWLSRRWQWAANSESNQGMGAMILMFFIMRSEALQGVCLQGVLALKHTTHTHTCTRDIAFFPGYRGIDRFSLKTDFMTTRIICFFIFYLLYWVSQLTSTGRVG